MSEASGLPSRIGGYPIEREVGRGGMGIVYLGRDTKLDRPVAIKVLPAAFASDPDRLVRFEREARLLASLTHPNIAAIYGLEESNGQRFLVLEYVEGETLAQRIARGALPIDDAVDVCRQIAAALEAAHEGGVIHRDLKPGNVKLTPAGEVKVLDFGLAKGGAASSSSDPSISVSPTVAITAMTGAGVILGTAAYMSPEQARGRAVDRRTDIWSFGCVLYECLTGTQAFAGETVSDMIAMILQGEPDWNALPANLPPRIRELLERCLTKDAKKRLRDIGEARLVLEGGHANSTSSAHRDAAAPAATIDARRAAAPMRLAVALAALLALSTAVLAWMLITRVPAPEPSARLSLPSQSTSGFQREIVLTALSPDGTMLAESIVDSSGTSMWLRPLGSIEGRKVPGIDGTAIPFWSPDGRFLAFANQDKLEKVDLRGGNPEVLCPITNQGRGGSWGSRDVIVFAPAGAGPIYKISKNGGTPVQVTKLDSAETGHRFPQFLPDGQHFLYASLPAHGGEYRIFIGSIDSPGRTLLMTAGGTPLYVEPGYLLFSRNGRLVAQRFDARSHRLQGEPVVLVDEPQNSEFLGAPTATASLRGTFAYFRNEAAPVELVWFDRMTRRIDRIPAPVGPYENLALSPDGSQAVLIRTGGSNESDLWLVDLARGAMTRFTYGPGRVDRPVWSPDGTRIAFSSNRNGRWDVFVKGVNGAIPEEAIVTSGSLIKYPDTWSPDGQTLVFEQLDEKTGWDLWQVPMTGAHTPQPYLMTPFDELGADIPSSGRWLTYVSNESGHSEAYVQSYPAAGNKHQISTAGGTFARCSADGRLIAFGTHAGSVFADVDPATGAASGTYHPFAPFPTMIAGSIERDFSRGLGLMRPDEATASNDLTVVLNWRSDLTRK